MCGTELKRKFVFSQGLVFERQMAGCAVAQKRIKPEEKMLQDGGMRREGERGREKCRSEADADQRWHPPPDAVFTFKICVYACACVCLCVRVL